MDTTTSSNPLIVLKDRGIFLHHPATFYLSPDNDLSAVKSAYKNSRSLVVAALPSKVSVDTAITEPVLAVLAKVPWLVELPDGSMKAVLVGTEIVELEKVDFASPYTYSDYLKWEWKKDLSSGEIEVLKEKFKIYCDKVFPGTLEFVYFLSKKQSNTEIINYIASFIVTIDEYHAYLKSKSESEAVNLLVKKIESKN